MILNIITFFLLHVEVNAVLENLKTILTLKYITFLDNCRCEIETNLINNFTSMLLLN